VGALSTKGAKKVTGSNQFRWTPGVALKYFSPVGPVQINLGYNSYDPLNGPVFTDRFIDPVTQKRPLTCVSGVVDNVCQPIQAVAPISKSRFFRHLVLTVAFPPDF
jgi:hypothetical protein